MNILHNLVLVVEQGKRKMWRKTFCFGFQATRSFLLWTVLFLSSWAVARKELIGKLSSQSGVTPRNLMWIPVLQTLFLQICSSGHSGESLSGLQFYVRKKRQRGKSFSSENDNLWQTGEAVVVSQFFLFLMCLCVKGRKVLILESEVSNTNA